MFTRKNTLNSYEKGVRTKSDITPSYENNYANNAAGGKFTNIIQSSNSFVTVNKTEMPFTIQTTKKSTFATVVGTPKKSTKELNSIQQRSNEQQRNSRRFITHNDNSSTNTAGIDNTKELIRKNPTPKRFMKLSDLEYNQQSSTRANTNKSESLVFPKVERDSAVPSTFRSLANENSNTV